MKAFSIYDNVRASVLSECSASNRRSMHDGQAVSTVGAELEAKTPQGICGEVNGTHQKQFEEGNRKSKS